MDLTHELWGSFFASVCEVIFLDALLDQLEEADVVLVAGELDTFCRVEETSNLGSLSERNVVCFSLILPEVTCSAGKATSRSLVNYQSTLIVMCDCLEGFNEVIADWISSRLLSWLDHNSCDWWSALSFVIHYISDFFKDTGFVIQAGWVLNAWPAADSSSKSKRWSVVWTSEVKSTPAVFRVLRSLNHGVLNSSSCGISLVHKMDTMKLLWNDFAKSAAHQSGVICRSNQISCSSVYDMCIWVFSMSECLEKLMVVSEWI